jgi:hypothetical protein
MQVLIATQHSYDLRDILKSHVDDCRTMGNIWIVETTATPEEIYRSIATVIN